ncbi:DUF397 domain-containing protein [Streptosporangium longisporum]|uniref:DUF397 domain-containing protein n=1 Tax=Streptosporangium longisporum TaxID=46187 RepID=A0ABN3XZB1_9ACTN
MVHIKPKATEFDLSSIVWIRGTSDQQIDDPVEVAFVGENILMRNGGTDNSTVLVFTRAEWDAFVAGAVDGEFDQ